MQARGVVTPVEVVANRKSSAGDFRSNASTHASSMSDPMSVSKMRGIPYEMGHGRKETHHFLGILCLSLD